MGLPPLEIDADVARARTPPAELYTDRELHELFRQRLFTRTWQWIDAPSPAREEAQPFTLLPGSLDEPLLLTRDREGGTHCLSNVCTHRGMLVCEAAGWRRGLRCGYHGRRFELDGHMAHAPGFEGAADFPSPSDDLPRLPLERWGPLLFTGLAPQPSFTEWLGPVRERLGWLPLDDFAPAPLRARDYEVRANWLLYCENYLEGFHVPFVHPGLNAVLDFEGYRTELFAHGSVQIGVAEEGGVCFEPPPGSPDGDRAIAGHYVWLFPNLMLNFYPWGLSLNHVVPLAVDRCRVAFRSFVWRPELLDVGAGAALHQVELEDEAVVESVQRGLRSRTYGRGRYSPRHELGTHHLHRLLARWLRENAR